MKDGIIVINKPGEMTSFDVVAILRKKLGVKRIGHLGTLDPMATGVLPVAIGKATRVMDYLDANIKEYVAEFTFGLTSDTDDIWGEFRMKSEDEYICPDEETIREAVRSFKGVIDQVPPKYAAIKKDGRKLYEYARSGQDIEIEPRRIYIESIDLMTFKDNTAVFKIRSSKGTYIRSIARDLGEKLGTGAVMSGLIRTSSGPFKLEDSVDMELIKSLPDAQESNSEVIKKHILPIDRALVTFPRVVLGDWESRLFSTGVKLRSNQWLKPDDTERVVKEFPLELPDIYDHCFRVYGRDGRFIGVGIEDSNGELKADKVFI